MANWQRRFEPTPSAPMGVDTNDALHAMAFKNFLACRTQLCAILLQALLNRCIVTQLFAAKVGGIARTRFLLLWRAEMPALC